MTDKAPHDLANTINEPDHTTAMVGQQIDATNRMAQVPMQILGTLVHKTASGDANVAGTEGTQDNVDSSAFTQARNYTTPVTCRVGARCAVYLDAAGSFALNILNAAGQTINGVDHSVTPFVALVAANQHVILRCAVADTDFELEVASLTTPDNYLRADAGATIGQDFGYAATTKVLASASLPANTYTPDPRTGQFTELTGSTATTIALPVVDGGESIGIADAISISLHPSYEEVPATGKPTGRASILEVRKVGSVYIAAWI